MSSAGFVHPGVFVSIDQLRATKARLHEGAQPWSATFEQMRASDYATRPAPEFTEFASARLRAEPGGEGYLEGNCSTTLPGGCVSYCGAYAVPDIGCSEIEADTRAVYTQALLWYYTGERAYAKRSIGILNAYAAHFEGNLGSNGPLTTAWMTEVMLRGAELIRYTYVPEPGEVVFNVRAFDRMVREALVDRLISFDWYTVPNNWMGSAADAMISAGVFLDDRALYDRGVALWREFVPNYIYVSSDGPYPTFLSASPVHKIGYVGTGTPQERSNLRCLWLSSKAPECKSSPMSDPGEVRFQHGQTMESCRDIGHSSLGLAAIIGAAETAYLQGDDLYGEQQERILAAVRYNSQIQMVYSGALWPTRNGYPTDFCANVPGLVRTGLTLSNTQVAVAYNAYAVRKGVAITTLSIPGYSDVYPRNDPLAAYISERLSDREVDLGHIDVWSVLTHHLAGG